MYISETNQLEDPRQQWHIEQEQMLKDYLVTAQDDLEVYTITSFYTVFGVQSINRVTTMLYIQTKMYRLYRKLTIYGHFLYDLYIFGIHL